VDLYEVFLEGYHTPLTGEQIAALFHAGRVRRHHRCKQVNKTKWRTIDELFPLLKYDSVSPLAPRGAESRFVTSALAVALAVFVATVAALTIYFGRLGMFAERDYIPISSQEKTDQRQDSTPWTTAFANPGRDVDRVESSRDRNARRELSRADQQRLAREQMQPDQAARAEQLRTSNERGEQATGRSFVVPLDIDYKLPDVGGLPVVVRIHDNDVTSFDVWINGARRRRVPKQKGITGSRTDETLIYTNGTASLYYVWEISGQLNSCLLRLRND
jgi:hypothetical protein